MLTSIITQQYCMMSCCSFSTHTKYFISKIQVQNILKGRINVHGVVLKEILNDLYYKQHKHFSKATMTEGLSHLSNFKAHRKTRNTQLYNLEVDHPFILFLCFSHEPFMQDPEQKEICLKLW